MRATLDAVPSSRSARRTLIADAALDVLAHTGARGLTHHAVDGRAGLAKGSTSYYCRTRVDLLALTLDRIVELDLADVAACRQRVEAGDDVALVLGELVEHWLKEPARTRTAARLELFLLASREDDLLEKLTSEREAFVALGQTINDAADRPVSPELLGAILMLVDGMLLTHIRLRLPAPAAADVRTTLREMLAA